MVMAVEAPCTGFPDNVLALTTTREGGVSNGPWRSLNLASHVGDSPAAVASNRRILHSTLPGGNPVAWLDQVHGTRVVDVAIDGNGSRADASICRHPGIACAVLTADCLPVLLCDRSGSVIAAAHAGWRGLAGGVLDTTVSAMDCEPADLMAWLGPCIGPGAFEVGPEVREAFCADAAPAQAAAIKACFRPSARAGHFLADLRALARWRLAALGVATIAADSRCTASSPLTFFSYRRDGVTGRMASVILIKG
ncbi:MAG: peptidoglycan editing factor PgeF [Chromatocurvus sp.]